MRERDSPRMPVGLAKVIAAGIIVGVVLGMVALVLGLVAAGVN